MDNKSPALSGIRFIDPKAADHVRARIDRDLTYYWNLQGRLRKWMWRDNATHKALCEAGAVVETLRNLKWTMQCAGKHGPDIDSDDKPA